MLKKFDWKLFADENSEVMGVRCKTLEEAHNFLSLAKTEMVKYNKNYENSVNALDYSCFDYYNLVDNIFTNEASCVSKDILVGQEGNDTIIFEWSDYMDKKVTNKTNKQKRKGEKNIMGNMMNKMTEGFMPSKVVGDEVALTMDGRIAIKRENGDYVTYNKETRTIENQMDLVLNGNSINKMCFYIPTQKLVEGDIYKDNEAFYYVSGIKNGDVKSISLSSGRNSTTAKETTIILGGKFYKKVTSLFSMQQNGSINPMLLMMMGNSEDEEDTNDENVNSMFQMMALSQMIGNNQSNQNEIGLFGGMNPMLLMMMNNGGKSNDMVQMMMMSQMLGQTSNNPFQQIINNDIVSTE